MRFLSFLLNALIFFLAFKYAILFSLRQGTQKNDVPDMYSLVYFFSSLSINEGIGCYLTKTCSCSLIFVFVWQEEGSYSGKK